MVEKIVLDENNRAPFTCPKCGKSWTKDLSDFKNYGRRIQLKCKCPCGYSFLVVQERRRNMRKNLTVTGAYFHNQRAIRGLITVKNISRSGVGLLLSTQQSFYEGDRLQLKFNLDDPARSFVDKEGIIKKAKDDYLRIQFVDENWADGFNDYFTIG